MVSPYSIQANTSSPHTCGKPTSDPQTGVLTARVGLRHYSPGLGRWTRRDPIGEIGGRNLYQFVSNHPVGLYDPLGLSWGDAIAGGSEGLGQIAAAINRSPWMLVEVIDQSDVLEDQLKDNDQECDMQNVGTTAQLGFYYEFLRTVEEEPSFTFTTLIWGNRGGIGPYKVVVGKDIRVKDLGRKVKVHEVCVCDRSGVPREFWYEEGCVPCNWERKETEISGEVVLYSRVYVYTREMLHQKYRNLGKDYKWRGFW